MTLPSLPVETSLPPLRRALAEGLGAVLAAPPGAGKTTIVPLSLLNEPWLGDRSILILEPRRLAARAAAARMARLLGESPGETVGYRIRFESRVSARTRIEVLTEGILTRRLQNDPGLSGAEPSGRPVGLVIFDEFHERHIHSDLALALCLDSRRVLREDLRILIMSATLDAEAAGALMGGAPVIRSPGKSYPVDIRYAVQDAQESLGRLPEAAAAAVRRAVKEDPGDVLVFLPGAWEIRRTLDLLSPAMAERSIDVLPLYGDLPWEAQDRAIRPGEGRRRVILATPIAETSLTIEGVAVVVDSGWARVPRYDPASGLTRLTTIRVSRASAEQRAGRAGRLGPGVCHRLWTKATHLGLIPHSIPEIRTADLAPLALELARWGVRDPGTLSWLDPPPPAAMARARELLRDLSAVDENGAITPEGRAMTRWPLHPRLSHMAARGGALGLGSTALDLAAILSERDILSGASKKSADLHFRLEALAAYRSRGPQGARSFGADPEACARVVRAVRQIQTLLPGAKTHPSPDAETVGLLLAYAYPDRIGIQRAPGDIHYRLASGRGARLPPSEHRMRPPFLVAASLDAGETEGTIHLAAPVRPEELRAHLKEHIGTEDVLRWDPREERVVAQREERLGEILLQTARLPNPDPDQLKDAMIQGIRQLGLEALPWSPGARDIQARVLWMRHSFPQDGWPDLSDTFLGETMEEWLGPHLMGLTRREHLGRLDLEAILKGRLDWKQNRALEEGAPTHLIVPSGSRLRLEYRPGEPPVLAVKLQEMFGLADTPMIGFGKFPVSLHLLSPARRPIQVTQDLRGFWNRTYAEVRKELKGRYPKHPWPEDPWVAAPTARPKRRRSH